MTGRLKGINHKFISAILAMVIVIMGMTNVVYGEEEEVLLEIDTTTLQMGVSTELTMILKNIDSAKLVSFDGIEQLEILSSGQSNSTQIVNGKRTKVSTVTYSVTPKEVGTIRLQAAIQVEDEIYETNVLEVTVTEMDESLAGTDADVFIRTLVSDDRVYFGEPVIITYELFSMYQVDKFGFLEDVVVDDFIVERNDEDRYEPNYMMINDEQFVMYKAEQLVLNATKAGDYTIDAFEFQANLGSGSMFSATKPKYLMTDEVRLNVLPLPQEGQPVGYKGLVGDIVVEAAYNQMEVASGDPITLTVTVSGSGNINSISEIASYGVFDGFTIYETEQDIKESYTENGYFATKEFELILIPKVSGAVEIEGFEIPYFDSKSEQYAALEVAGTTVQIGDSTTLSSDTADGITTADAEPLLINQVSYAPSTEEYFTLTIPKKVLGNVVIGILVLLGLIVGVVGLYRWHRRNNDPIRVMKREVTKATDNEGLYEVVIRIYRHVYGVDLRSTTVSEMISIIEDDEILVSTKQIMFYMEHDKHYNQQRFEEIKETTMKIIEKIMAF